MEEPLLPPADHGHPSSSDSSIILRLLSFLSIALISIWANHEASKGFGISIINDADHTPSGHRFALLYISNDKATRILLNASSFVQNLLYKHDDNTIRHVTLHLAARNPADRVTVDPKRNNEFVIGMSPLLIANDSSAVVSMIFQGMARVWLLDSGWSRAPSWMLDGMVRCINGLAGLGPVGDWGGRPSCRAKAVAETLYNMERREKGLLQRVNEGVRGGDGAVEDALWMVAEEACDRWASREYYASD